jgi:hypothetical protein
MHNKNQQVYMSGNGNTLPFLPVFFLLISPSLSFSHPFLPFFLPLSLSQPFHPGVFQNLFCSCLSSPPHHVFFLSNSLSSSSAFPFYLSNSFLFISLILPILSFHLSRLYHPFIMSFYFLPYFLFLSYLPLHLHLLPHRSGSFFLVFLTLHPVPCLSYSIIFYLFPLHCSLPLLPRNYSIYFLVIYLFFCLHISLLGLFLTFSFLFFSFSPSHIFFPFLPNFLTQSYTFLIFYVLPFCIFFIVLFHPSVSLSLFLLPTKCFHPFLLSF